MWPLGTLAGMPFEVRGHAIKGPGTNDMKGGLTQLVFALEALRELGLPPVVTPVVFINSDEEIGSPESRPLIRMLARRACRAFVLEPALGLSGKLKTARKGAGSFVVRVAGKTPPCRAQSRSGGQRHPRAGPRHPEAPRPERPRRGISVNVGKIDGGIGANVVAPTSTAMVDVRVRTSEDARWIERAIRGLQPVTPGTRLEIEGAVDLPPLEPTPRNRTLWEAARRVGQEIGLELEEGLAGGVSDGNTISLYTSTLDGLGAVGDGRTRSTSSSTSTRCRSVARCWPDC